MKVGFVGLGIMGTPMAEHLIRAGHDVHLFSIPSIPESLVAAGGKPCANGRAVAEAAAAPAHSATRKREWLPTLKVALSPMAVSTFFTTSADDEASPRAETRHINHLACEVQNLLEATSTGWLSHCLLR